MARWVFAAVIFLLQFACWALFYGILIVVLVLAMGCAQGSAPPSLTPLPTIERGSYVVPTPTMRPLATGQAAHERRAAIGGSSGTGASLEYLHEFGQSFWDGVDYKCAARYSAGACITYDSEYRTYIFFAINRATKQGVSYFVTPNKQDVLSVVFEALGHRDVTPAPPHDFVELCTYSDYDRWHLSVYSDCEEEELPGGLGVAALKIVLADKWPELLGGIR